MDNTPCTRVLHPLEAKHLRGRDGLRILVIGDDGMGYIVDLATSTIGELFYVTHLAKQGTWAPVEQSLAAEILSLVAPLLQGMI